MDCCAVERVVRVSVIHGFFGKREILPLFFEILVGNLTQWVILVSNGSDECESRYAAVHSTHLCWVGSGYYGVALSLFCELRYQNLCIHFPGDSGDTRRLFVTGISAFGIVVLSRFLLVLGSINDLYYSLRH